MRWASSARLRARVMQPAARQTDIRLTTRSRPARRARNASSRCAAHNHTATPNGSGRSSRGPDPAPTQIAHGGRLPNPLAL